MNSLIRKYALDRRLDHDTVLSVAENFEVENDDHAFAVDLVVVELRW